MAKAPCTDLAREVAELAFDLAAVGEARTIDDVVERMRGYEPLAAITRDDVVNAIVEASTGKSHTLDEIAKRIDEIKREAKGEVGLRRKIAAIEAHLNEGSLPDSTPRAAKTPTPVIGELKALAKELGASLRHSPPAVKTRLLKSINELTRRLEEGDFAPPVSKQKMAENKEVARLEYERDQLRKQINRRIEGMKPKTVFQKAAEPFSAARAIMTSGEFSAVLRQGAFIGFGNPIRAVRAIPDMFRAFKSEESFVRMSRELGDRENAPLYEKSKLYLAAVDGAYNLTSKEEAYQSKWAEKIPLVRHSERAYTAFLNRLRADSFDAMAATLARNGETTLDEAKAIAKYINMATGRGDLGPLEQAATGLATAFFAPRHAVSRFQMLLGVPLYRGSARTRKLIATEYAKFLIGAGVVYALGAMAGGEDEWDPRSSDFGKMRFGNTRIDPLAGVSQATVLLSRIATGETKSTSTGRITPISGDKVRYGQKNAFDVVADFMRTKFSPITSTAFDVVQGQNMMGENRDITTLEGAGNIAQNLLVPMTYGDIYEAMIENGVVEGAALGLLAMFGMGLQVHSKR